MSSSGSSSNGSSSNNESSSKDSSTGKAGSPTQSGTSPSNGVSSKRSVPQQRTPKKNRSTDSASSNKQKPSSGGSSPTGEGSTPSVSASTSSPAGIPAPVPSPPSGVPQISNGTPPARSDLHIPSAFDDPVDPVPASAVLDDLTPPLIEPSFSGQGSAPAYDPEPILPDLTPSAGASENLNRTKGAVQSVRGLAKTAKEGGLGAVGKSLVGGGLSPSKPNTAKADPTDSSPPPPSGKPSTSSKAASAVDKGKSAAKAAKSVGNIAKGASAGGPAGAAAAAAKEVGGVVAKAAKTKAKEKAAGVVSPKPNADKKPNAGSSSKRKDADEKTLDGTMSAEDGQPPPPASKAGKAKEGAKAASDLSKSAAKISKAASAGGVAGAAAAAGKELLTNPTLRKYLVPAVLLLVLGGAFMIIVLLTVIASTIGAITGNEDRTQIQRDSTFQTGITSTGSVDVDNQTDRLTVLIEIADERNVPFEILYGGMQVATELGASNPYQPDLPTTQTIFPRLNPPILGHLYEPPEEGGQTTTTTTTTTTTEAPESGDENSGESGEETASAPIIATTFEPAPIEPNPDTPGYGYYLWLTEPNDSQDFRAAADRYAQWLNLQVQGLNQSTIDFIIENADSIGTFTSAPVTNGTDEEAESDEDASEETPSEDGEDTDTADSSPLPTPRVTKDMLLSPTLVAGTEPVWKVILSNAPVDVSAMRLQPPVGQPLRLADAEVQVYGGSFAQQLFDYEDRLDASFTTGDSPSLELIADTVEPLPGGIVFILPHNEIPAAAVSGDPATATTTTSAPATTVNPTVTTTTIDQDNLDGTTVELDSLPLEEEVAAILDNLNGTQCVLFVNLPTSTALTDHPSAGTFREDLKTAADLAVLSRTFATTVTWAATEESFVGGDRTQLSEAGVAQLNTAMTASVAARCPRSAPVDPGSNEDSTNPALDRRISYAENVLQAATGLAFGGGDIVGALISDGFPPALAQAVANTPQLVLQHRPECFIDHALLAAVTWKESRGLWDRIGPNGISDPFILGVPLNGSRFGSGDEETTLESFVNDHPIELQRFWGIEGEPFDRALGAFQFIPTSWLFYSRDANGDGVNNPQDVADAALAAAMHLCISGDDLKGGEASLPQALLGYNRSAAYGQSVLERRTYYQQLFIQFNTTGIPEGPVGVEQTVTVGGIAIHVSMAQQLQAMVDHAARDGIQLEGWGWRSNQRQQELRVKNGCAPYLGHPDVFTVPSGSCRTPTAIPGRSRHERGTAIDFHVSGTTFKTRTHPHFLWLATHASAYGFFNLPSEPWHWSNDGS